jgi:transcription elongation GreA/GreB family factor
MFRAVHPDVRKLIDAGRIPPAVGEKLTKVSPGSFCLHKSFGAGKVVSWDLAAKRVVIDFEKSPGQEMDLAFAMQRTEWIPADDFRARKIEETEVLRSLSQSDPVQLVVHLLESHGGSMSQEAVEKELCGTVVPEQDFRKWWEGVRKALKESRRVTVPSRRTEAMSLRAGVEDPAGALIADFQAARDIRGMIRALEAIAADIPMFTERGGELSELLGQIDEGASKAARVQLGHALQLVAARDEVVGSSSGIDLPDNALRLSDLVQKADPSKLADELAGLPAARQRAVFRAFPAAFGGDWVSRIVKVFERAGSRGGAEIARMLSEEGFLADLLTHLRSSISRRSLGVDALIWVCRERSADAAEVFSGEVGASILNLLENDHLSDGPRKTSRLQSMLNDDRALLADLVGRMDANEARNFARRMLECPVFGDLEKKSLMARIIKVRPETAELVSDEGASREEVLLVSWESLERKKTELDEIVRVRIPQNTKDISIAREYGDLRENFEYKSARDLQKYLMFRKTELEKEIHRARGTDFQGTDTSKVNVGTVVTLSDGAGNTREVAVLGAWDSDPERGVVSYLSEVGKALVDRAPGSSVEVPDPATGALSPFTIASVRAWVPPQA